MKMTATVAGALLLVALPIHAAEPDGRALFDQNCVMCHQANATGAPGLAPSLAGTLSRYLQSADGKQYLSQILISGLAGRYESNGTTFMGLMPSFKDQLSDAEIAATLNYVLSTYNDASAAAVEPAAVSAARARAPSTSDTQTLRTSIK